MRRVESKFRIGCQSWGYEDWITPAAGSPVFYPRGTRKQDMLSLYSRIFDTIEVDATLYGVPPESTYQNWHGETPDEFIFSLKFPREITHDLALRGRSRELMLEFVDRSRLLGDKLGLFLIQFPAAFEASPENQGSLRAFLPHLPKDLRFAVEFRNDSWFVQETFDELQNAGAALCLVEGKWVSREIMLAHKEAVATPFRYFRVMGERDLLKFDRVQRDRSEIIDRWAETIKTLNAAEIYIYSDNYFEGFAPGTANKLRQSLGLTRVDPDILETQGSLF
jgi:uncharacterized protein YecE (DUF72 family)